MFKGKMPDITQAQLLAALTWIVSQAVATGWVNSDVGQKWLQIGSSVIAAAWVIGDAILRSFRNIAAAKQGTHPTGVTPPSQD